MLQPDVVNVRQFYSSPLGQCVRRDLSSAIGRFWGKTESDAVVVSIGFALPYLRPFLESSPQVLSLMFPEFGAMYWPADTSNHTVLTNENALPCRDNTVAYVLVCHAVEHSAHLSTLMREIYRILQPGGKALFIIPNRLGQWTRNANTPFGSGHPYQISQMRHRAELAGLTYVRASTALFYMPSHWRMVLRMSRTMEWLGRLLLPNFGGVLLVEVEKQLYASIPEKGVKMPVMPILYPTQTAPSSKSLYNRHVKTGFNEVSG